MIRPQTGGKSQPETVTLKDDNRPPTGDTDFVTWARMHHKVVGNFRSEADVRSLHYRR